PAALWDVLLKAMQSPAAGEPHRPTQLQVLRDDRWEALRPHVEEVGISLDVVESLDLLESALEELHERLGSKAEPGLLEGHGVRPEQVAGFYDAAAWFFERKPWKKVGYESAIEVRCDRFSGGPWYAVLMGQSGLAVGLALYEDLRTLQRMWAGGGD